MRLALITGIGGFVLALLSALVATSADSSTSGVAVRAVLVTVLLFAAVRLALVRRSRGRTLPTAVAGLLLGYLLTLGWFNGQVYAARLLLEDGAAARALVDLVLWLVVGLAAARTVGADGPDRSQGYV